MGPVQHTLYVIVFSAMLAAYFGLAYLGFSPALAFISGIAGVGMAFYICLKLYELFN